MKLQLLNSRKRSKLIQKHTSRKQFNRKKLRSKKKTKKKIQQFSQQESPVGRKTKLQKRTVYIQNKMYLVVSLALCHQN